MGGYDAAVYRMYLGQIPMFASCSQGQIDEVQALSEFRTLDAGTVILREGEPGDELFVLGSGEAVVDRGGTEVARLESGAFFGELGLFDDVPRSATVVAVSGVTLLALGREPFRKLLADLPGFRDAVIMGMARRLHHLDAKV